MPQLPFSQALTANQLNFNPISAAGWQYEFTTLPSRVVLLIRSTDTNQRLTVYSGSETIQERGPIQGGGTAGVTPSQLNTEPVVWRAAARDRIKIVVDNTTAATPTIDGLIIINPL